MARIGLSEHVKIASVRARSLRQSAATRWLGGSLLRWRRYAGAVKPLVIIPQDLRPADPSFWGELESGHLGLSGAVAYLDGRSPFDIEPPSAAWQRELHGFSWLRHLSATGTTSAAGVARGTVLGWLHTDGWRQRGNLVRRQGAAIEPAVQARRILSWIAHAPFILDGATAAEFDAFSHGLALEIARLSQRRRDATGGYDQLLVLTTLVAADLATGSNGRRLYAAVSRLDGEIERQILPDGGHISRNPDVLIQLLLDWLPLKSCLAARNDPQQDTLAFAISRMLSMLRFLRLGDGGVARFNGMAVGDPAGLATLLAYDDRPLPAWPVAPQSRYARLSQGDITVLMDAGSPPPLMHSCAAHAGCLSIEVSSRTRLLFVNAGAPGPSGQGWRAVSRATASHSTLCLGETSSSRLVRHAGLEAMLDAVPLHSPSLVTASTESSQGGKRVEAVHDGYLERLGVMHRRNIHVSACGTALSGIDRLETRGDRLKRDVPFAIHFHLHPDSVCEPCAGRRGARPGHIISLPDGQRWLFEASAATGIILTSVEESTCLAGSSGPRPSLQLVVRGATGGDFEVHWQATLIDEPGSRNEGTTSP